VLILEAQSRSRNQRQEEEEDEDHEKASASEFASFEPSVRVVNVDEVIGNVCEQVEHDWRLLWLR